MPHDRSPLEHHQMVHSAQPGDRQLGGPGPLKPMKQMDRPLMTYDKRRATREMRRPVFGSRKVAR